MGDNYEWHRDRYRMSLAWLDQYIKDGQRVLELGGTTPFTDTLKERFPRTKFFSTGENDLRKPIPLASCDYDVILCMEVIEHISDTPAQDIGSISTFKCNGMTNMLSEAYRMLANGGMMLLTTPNICGYRALTNMLRGIHPFTYSLHTRELSIPDIKKLLTDAGFVVERISTERVWHWNDIDFDRIDSVLSYFGVSTTDRDDCVFVLSNKPLS